MCFVVSAVRDLFFIEKTETSAKLDPHVLFKHDRQKEAERPETDEIVFNNYSGQKLQTSDYSTGIEYQSLAMCIRRGLPDVSDLGAEKKEDSVLFPSTMRTIAI